MKWLLSPGIRSFIALAAAKLPTLNLALVVPSIYMLEAFDRVFSSRSVETLVVLSVFAPLALGFCVDRAHGTLLRRVARVVDKSSLQLPYLQHQERT
ncbi:MAG: hypothetical protein OEM00_12715 [Burkholderiaceae bacterium]|nr:hypothetical protein [Burkholderiaceae bacterium]